ncbi:MAG: serine/threonine protein kinase [Planctomycetota bacterium]|nr:MAG: serine/threonine protein kinase [Planctomycetota bacterium]
MRDETPRTNPEEAAFEEYLALLLEGNPPDQEEFIGRQPVSMQSALRKIFQEYDQLQRSFREPQPGQMFGPYRMNRMLGRGGNGSVWEAEEVHLGRRLALKLLNPESALRPGLRQRFFMEARLASRIRHPGVAAIFAFGSEQNHLYLAQELVENGRTLAHELNRIRQLDDLPEGHYGRMAMLFRDAALALQAVHQAGVVHRDLKPTNMLLDEADRLRLSDFGLARGPDSPQLTQSGFPAGTPYYMSPEQISGTKKVEARSDIFSLGVSLYEALTLRRPFEGDSRHQVFQAILHDHPMDPVRRRRLPSPLAWICLKALEKKPEARYASAAEMAEDLERFLRQESVLAKAPGKLKSFRRWVGRHPVLSAGMGMLLLGSLVVGRLYWLSLEAQKEAEYQARKAKQAFQIFEQALQLPSGYQELGNAVSFPEFLSRAADQMRTGLKEYPEELALLSAVFGRMQWRLENFSEAEKLWRDALSLRRQIFGDEHPLTLDCQAGLAWVLVRDGRSQEGLRHLQDWMEAAPRPTEEQFSQWMQMVFVRAEAKANLGQVHQAYDELVEVENQNPKFFPAGSPQKVVLNSYQAQCLQLLGRTGEALSLNQEALSVQKRLAGEEHPNTVFLKLQALKILSLQGQDTLEAWEEVLLRAEKVCGRESKMTLDARRGLAMYFSRFRQPMKVVETLEPALQLTEFRYGSFHPVSLAVRADLGSALLKCGRGREGEEILRPLLQWNRPEPPPPDPRRVALINQASYWGRQGNREQAILGFEQALLEAPHSRLAKQRLAWLLVDAEDPQPEELKRAIGLAKETLEGANLNQQAKSYHALAWAYYRVGDQANLQKCLDWFQSNAEIPTGIERSIQQLKDISEHP